jgi:hypothetical protein
MAERDCILRWWVLDSSMDGEHWSEIDRSADGSRWRERRLRSFEMATVVNSKFIRLTQLRTNNDGTHRLAITAVEFYASFVESEGPPQ